LEETFHLSDPAEIAEYERSKRVQQIARLREARLAEREEQDREAGLLEEEKSGQKRVSWPEEEIAGLYFLSLCFGRLDLTDTSHLMRYQHS
jgi:hypothetical protein